MIPTDNFYWARYCTLWAAGDLYGYGSNEYWQVWNAWNAVGAPS
jgi:Zn-dependent metalloprotease